MASSPLNSFSLSMNIYIYDIPRSHRERGLLSLSRSMYIYIYTSYTSESNWERVTVDNCTLWVTIGTHTLLSLFGSHDKVPRLLQMSAHKNADILTKYLPVQNESLKGKVSLIKEKHHWACTSLAAADACVDGARFRMLHTATLCHTLQHVWHTNIVDCVDPMYIVDSVDPQGVNTV